MALYTGVRRLLSQINNLNIRATCDSNVSLERSALLRLSSTVNKIHTSSVREDLMEFFDDKENWGELEVRVGRSWKPDELRIKSNSDLHKLWYVLLKERNMLMTMEHEYNAQYKPFPNPERLDKVNESMENLEMVVRERNRAYFELETGETGERATVHETNCFGLPHVYKAREYIVPKRMNKKYWEEYKLKNHTTDHFYINNFLTKLEEKKNRIKNYSLKKQYRMVCQYLSVFPNIDEKALKEKFPEVDIEQAKRDKLSRGHRENEF